MKRKKHTKQTKITAESKVVKYIHQLSNQPIPLAKPLALKSRVKDEVK